MSAKAPYVNRSVFDAFFPPPVQNDLDDPERGMIFVCSATHKTKSMFFFLAQTEQGDIFKVTLETDEEMVRDRRGRGLRGQRAPIMTFRRLE